MVDWLRRSLGWGRDARAEEHLVDDPDAAPIDAPEAAEARADDQASADRHDGHAASIAPEGVACPYCAHWIEPAPHNSRLCPRCRQRIVVRHDHGRTVYFTEAAVAVFEAERQREHDEQRWTVDRREWLRLARIAAAPEGRRQRLEAQHPTAEVVAASKALYLSAVDRAVRAARRAKHWTEVGNLRREQAAALYAEAGSPVPPPDDVVALHVEGTAAQLRALAEHGTHAELVGAACCKPCRGDDGKAFKIADELRLNRLPHAGCPRGLCACEWWVSVPAPPKRRRRRAAPRATAAAGTGAPEQAAPASDA